MDNEKDRILKGLKEAMQAEVDGHHFYKLAAEATSDPLGKKVFQALAQDEIDHFIFLKAQYNSFLETGKADLKVKLGKPSNSSESPIFSDDFKNRLKEAHYEMSALSIGAKLELSSIQFYKSEAKATPDPDVKAFYNDLAKWEETHHRMLLKQQHELQEDYWHNSGFYPF